MRRRSTRLVLRAAPFAAVAALALPGGAPAKQVPSEYRCCFRVDTLMTGRLDTTFENAAGGPPQRATWTFMNSELLVYSRNAKGPRLRRASARRGGPWPHADGPGTSFGVGRVTRGACDVTDSSLVWKSAANPMTNFYAHRGRRYLYVVVGSPIADVGVKADDACDETQHGVRTGPLDGLDIGGATSHLLNVPPLSRFMTKQRVRIHSRIAFGKDVTHEDDFSTPLAHDTTGFSVVDVCFRYVPPARVKAEAARIRAQAETAPTLVSSLPCR